MRTQKPTQTPPQERKRERDGEDEIHEKMK